MPGPARHLPALPVLVRAVDDQRTTARSLLEAAARTEPGQAFTVAGVTLIRAVVARGPARPSGPMTRQQASGATSLVKRTTHSGVGRSSRCSAPPASGLRSYSSSTTTAWCNTGSPPPARSSPCCRSCRQRPTPKGCSWSARNWQKCSAPSSPASACAPGRSRWYRPTTHANASGHRRRLCCSNAGSAPSAGRSPPPASASSCPKPSPPPG